ncbi:MAG TPA: hypothetical protein VGY32_01825 [Solirubrobacteraceae bacterium]|jgi:hypothetical protein|nr:hypothetical protein [Solirubrobacteraceae bacterium]
MHTRRTFLRSAGLGALALGGLPQLARASSALSLQSLADPRLLPGPHQIRSQVEAMCALGPRLTGSPAHMAWIDQLEQDWAAAGVAVTRDHFTFPRWLAESWSLNVLDGSGAGPVPISSYFPYTAPTSPRGVTAPLVYVGPVPLPSISGNPLDLYSNQWALERWRKQLADDLKAQLAAIPGGVAGKIVLLEAPVPPLAAGDFTPFVTYNQEPVGSQMVKDAYSDYKRIWIVGAFIQYVLEAITQLGPVGAVFALDASRHNAAGQYTPYAQPQFKIPAVYVDRNTGARLRKLAQGTPRVNLTLTAQVSPNSPSDSLVGIMPGDGSTDEVLILNTHTDGQNAFEENGGIALTALARYFAALGPKARRRTLVFSAFTGHFGPSLPQSQGFVDNHPDLIKRAAASVTVEHFGATEWLDNARGYYASGLAETGAAWHSQTGIAVPLVESIRANSFQRTSALRPIGDYMVAVGGPFHKAGVPTVSYIAGPNYLVSLHPNDHLDKLDTQRFALELRWFADLIQRLDQLPKAALQAGDTTVWGQDGGALNSLP